MPASSITDDLSAHPPATSPPALNNRELHRLVWNLSWPSVTTMLLQTVNSLMDSFFVGHLPGIGKQALAATGAGGNVLFMMFSLAMGVTVGTTALVARFVGAQETEQAVHATGQSLALGAALGLLVGVPAWLCKDLLANALLNGAANPEAARLCAQFLSMALLSNVAMFIMNVFAAAFRGLGDTRTPLFISIITVLTHIGGNAVLIYGRFGLPQLGVQGAGIALSLSMTLGMILFWGALVKYSPLGAALKKEHLTLRWDWAKRILRIGIPASIQGLLRTTSMGSFVGMLAHAPEGAAAVAALNIGMRAEAIAFMPGFGYSIAASALVGQNLGAKNPEQAERSAWAATVQSIGVMSFMATLFFAFAYLIPRAFTSDPTVIQLSADYLRISAFGEPFLALGMVLTGALQGAGETIRPTYITLMTMWVVRLPLTYLMMFPLKMHTHGAWIAMLITTVVGGLLTISLFRAGHWKRVKV